MCLYGFCNCSSYFFIFFVYWLNIYTLVTIIKYWIALNRVIHVQERPVIKHQFTLVYQVTVFNTLTPRQNGRHFPDGIFEWIFLYGIVWISITISLKFVPKCSINNIPASVLIMAWRRPGDKPLSEPMMVSLLTPMRHLASVSYRDRVSCRRQIPIRTGHHHLCHGKCPDQRDVGTRFASLIFANMGLANLVLTSRWSITGR